MIKKIKYVIKEILNFSCVLSTCNGVIQVFLKRNYFQIFKRLLSTTEEPREERTLKNDTVEKVIEGHSSLAAN